MVNSEACPRCGRIVEEFLYDKDGREYHLYEEVSGGYVNVYECYTTRGGVIQ